MQWTIVADSSIDLFDTEQVAPNIRLVTVPFTVTVGSDDYVDDASLDVEQFTTAMKSCKVAGHTACPATGAWLEQFETEGNVIALTITSGLSGSYNSACAARELLLEQQPDKHIAVLNSLSVGPEMVLIFRHLCEQIEQGLDFDAVVASAQEYMKRTHLVFALASFDNLVKNGRMNKLAGFVAHKLSLMGVAIASEKGTIEMKGIARGQKKATEIMLNDMKQKAARIPSVVISHCQNLEFAQILQAEIKALWESAQVTILPMRGLCSYYAERGGLIIGYATEKC